LFGGCKVVDAAEGLGFKTSKQVTVASITYEMYIVKTLLESVREVTGELPKEVVIAVPGIRRTSTHTITVINSTYSQQTSIILREK
jgi:hypothetical protein